MSSAVHRSRLPAGRRGRGALALVATLAAVAGAVAFVGPDAVGTALAGADAGTVALVAAVAVAVLVARGLALRVLLGVLGHDAPVARVLGAYVATTVVSTVVPGGRAGGAPVNGLLVARSSAADYEDGVAAVVAVSALTNVLVGAFGVLGVAYLLATAGTAGTGSADVAALAAVGVGLVALAAAVVVALWRVRDRATDGVVAAAARIAGALRVVPRVTPPDRAAIADRADRFRAALARLRAGSPRQLATLVGLLAVAHALTVVALWLSFRAVGESVSVGVLLAVIPAAVAAAVVPAPGASGVDAALVGLLAAGTSAVAPVAGAAVLVYRVATSGPALAVGGAVVAAMASLGWFRDPGDAETTDADATD